MAVNKSRNTLAPRKVPRPTRRSRPSRILGTPPKYTGQSTKEYLQRYFAVNDIFRPCIYLVGNEEVVA